MNRFLLPLGGFALLVVVLGIGIWHAPEKGIIPSPLIGKPAPQFALPDLADPAHTVDSHSLTGRWYLFNVWGTWCFECRAEQNTLLEVRRAGVLPLIGLDWKDDDGEARAWLEQLGNPYQVVAVDHVGRTAIDWGVYAAPETFLVNPQGIVVYKVTGALTHDVWVHDILPRVPGHATAGS
ncbi:MAG: DsbE family thiol:disulfide interchange protein [Steroidobacteraceae bacterium]